MKKIASLFAIAIATVALTTTAAGQPRGGGPQSGTGAPGAPGAPGTWGLTAGSGAGGACWWDRTAPLSSCSQSPQPRRPRPRGGTSCCFGFRHCRVALDFYGFPQRDRAGPRSTRRGSVTDAPATGSTTRPSNGCHRRVETRIGCGGLEVPGSPTESRENSRLRDRVFWRSWARKP